MLNNLPIEVKVGILLLLTALCTVALHALYQDSKRYDDVED